MRRIPARLALRTLRVHPNGAVGGFAARTTLPTPGRWAVVLSGAPAALDPDTLEVEVRGGRVQGVQWERFAEGREATERRLWVELEAEAAGPVFLELEGSLGWASWRCTSLCVQTANALDWSVWGEFWLQTPLDPETANLELSTRRLPDGPRAPKTTGPLSPNRDPRAAFPRPAIEEIAALAATRGGPGMGLDPDHPDAPRLLDPEPADALGAHDVHRPVQWMLGPDGTGRACLASTVTPLPEGCVVRPGRDGRPRPRMVWQGPCPLPGGMPAGPFDVQASGRRQRRSLRPWTPGSIRSLELGPDPRVRVRRVIETTVEGPRQDVRLDLEVGTRHTVRVRCLEPVPRSVDPQVRVDLYALEPRDTAFEDGMLDFQAELGPGEACILSSRFAVTCPPGQHPVRVPGGPA